MGMLKRIIVSYLCWYFAMGVIPASAVGTPGPFTYDAPNDAAELSPNDTTSTTPHTGPAYLDNAHEFAQDLNGDNALSQERTSAHLSTKGDATPPMRGSEYISGYYKGAVLMPVNIWGAVQKPGLHQVPTGTDLMQLITLAGGPNADAELDHLIIKRTTKDGEKVIKLALNDFIDSTHETPLELEPNDTVILPATKPMISTNTLTLITVIATVVGIVASSVIIAGQLRK